MKRVAISTPESPEEDMGVNARSLQLSAVSRRSTLSLIAAGKKMQYDQQKHFAIIIFISSHALLLTGIVLMLTGATVLCVIYDFLLTTKSNWFFTGIILLIVAGTFSCLLTTYICYLQHRSQYSMLYIIIALILLSGLLIVTIKTFRIGLKELHDYHYNHPHNFTELLMPSYTANEDVDFWFFIQQRYRCVGIDNHDKDTDTFEYIQYLTRLNTDLMKGHSFDFLQQHFHRGCSQQILNVLEHYNRLARAIALVHLSVVIVKLIICVIFYVYFTGLYRVFLCIHQI